MDSSQDNNFGNAMPSGGGIGVDSGVNPGVGVDSGVNLGVGVNSGVNPGVGVGMNQPMPANAGQPMPASAGQPMSTMNQGQPAMPVNPVQPVMPMEQGQSVVLDGLGQQMPPLGQGQPVMSNGLGQQMAPVSQVQPIGSGNLEQQMSPMDQEQSIVPNNFSQPMSPMGMNMNMMNQSMAMSGDTGDIILNTDEGKKSKKGWIVGAILGLIVIAAVVTVAWLKPWEQGGGSDSSFIDTVKEKYNIYANYLVSGEVSDEPLTGVYETGRLYALDKAVGRIDKVDRDYLTNAMDYWNDYWVYYSSDSNQLGKEKSSNMKKLDFIYEIGEQNRLMNFVFFYYTRIFRSGDELLSLYLEQGREGALREIERLYDSVGDNGFNKTDAFWVASKAEAVASVDLYDKYMLAGCIKEKIVDISCTSMADEISKALTDYLDIIQNKDLDMIHSAVISIMRNVWIINSKEVKYAV